MAVKAVSTALLSAGSAEAIATVSLEVSTLAAGVVLLRVLGLGTALLQPVTANAAAARTVRMRRFFLCFRLGC
jgi:hypothetical protein